MERAARVAWWLGLAGLLVGALLVATRPQRPDGDATALRNFAALHRDSALHRARESLWLNVAGALAAWGALHRLFEARRWGWRLVWVG
ncbi:MAG: hypothetical protein H0T73_18775, partial [Ardenticatenales bacterium]|nr:hypothetical protein [Ardenticatenales bacterium]